MDNTKRNRIKSALKWFADKNEDVASSKGDFLIYYKPMGFYQVCGDLFPKMLGDKADIICTHNEMMQVIKEQNNG